MAEREARPQLSDDMSIARSDRVQAIEHALAGEWEAAHGIVQRDESDPTACWIHGCMPSTSM